MSISDVSLQPVSASRKMLSCSASSPSSSNAQLRKIKKPLIERRRRERINECLGQLKALVLEATNKDESRYSKMEKADILEMTVAHLKFIHSARRSYDVTPGSRHAADVPTTVASVVPECSSGSATLRYMMGYNECVREVASYLAGDNGETGRLGDDIRAALMRHLDDYMRLIVTAVRLPSPNVSGSCTRFDGPTSDLRDIRTSSPPSIELAVDSAGATPWRHRCDSGVYSGASSPAQADELAVGAVIPAAFTLPSELSQKTSDQLSPSLTICGDMQLSQTQDVGLSAEVWRPW